MFRELKSRKAKFGFTCGVNAHTFIWIADAVKEARKEDPALLFEVGGYTSHNDAKVYTNVESAANVIREHIVYYNQFKDV